MTFGENVWESYISRWIAGTNPDQGDSAMATLERGGRVWVWVDEDTRMPIGVSSFGDTTVNDWPEKRRKIQANLLPVIGVDCKFRNRGYGMAMMSDVLAEARQRAALRPALVLYVDEENPARDWYINKFGFQIVGKPYVSDGRPHTRLVVNVRCQE